MVPHDQYSIQSFVVKQHTGIIIKYNKHGALASIEEGVSGLVHISEFGDDKTMKEKVEIGKTYSFKISIFEPEKQRMILKLN